MAGSMKKGDLSPDPRVVIPKLEDYIDVSSLTSGLPAAPGIIDRVYAAVGGYGLGNRATDNGCMLQAVAQHMVTTGLPDVSGKVHRVAGCFAVGD